MKKCPLSLNPLLPEGAREAGRLYESFFFFLHGEKTNTRGSEDESKFLNTCLPKGITG
jgi:hypothetical protein